MHFRALAVFLAVIMLLAAPSASAQEESFRLGVGDKLRITVFEEPDMSGEYVVGARGRLSLPLIGEIGASDLTLSDLETRITEALADGFIQNASVSVELLESRPFYILGDVSNPGSYPYVDGMTVVNAIALAGGNLITQEDEVRAMVDVARSRERRDLLAKDYLSALAREARLIAERDGLANIQFPTELKATAAHSQVRTIVEGETRIFQARISVLADQAEIVENLKQGVRKEISAYNTQMAAIRDQVDVINRLLEDQNKLLAQNLTRKAQVMDLQIRAAGSRVTRGNLLVQLARAEQRLQELDLRVTDSRNRFISEVADGLTDVQGQLSRIRTSLQTAHQELRQNRRKLGRARSALAGERTMSVSITRRTDTGVLQIDAEESTPISPGDIVKVVEDLAGDADDVSFDISSLIESFSNRGGNPDTPSDADEGAPIATPETVSETAADAATGLVATEDAAEAVDAAEIEDAANAEDATPAAQDAAAAPDTTTQIQQDAEPDEQEASPAADDSGDQVTETPETTATAEQTATVESSGLIKSIQIGLNVLGFTDGLRLTVDGVKGPQTQTAIVAYQSKHNLPQDGVASPELLRHIQSQLN